MYVKNYNTRGSNDQFNSDVIRNDAWLKF